ncbi:hypothetical protein M427DRAFT_98973 [Gonapodya prolifera JEL478]|uniref:DUF4334 domain-containing protein n=1 Tax=Gonapodya prolifera (strain JEL478) TaxID=1344416 RepID=A0A139AEV3_GONPJ|nr:hypothetical protein M427DRAFT_98973 [Gonapodya prolifera JEL478]|eukprot:KXS15288.1 hypothetical protein M427DRAFT_98973 [Gonapodya prolifera JEL478]
MVTDPIPDFETLCQSGCDISTALRFFDTLPPLSEKEMLGQWTGGEIKTGHPMEGFLIESGWVGKEFLDVDTVHPLQFDDGRGGRWNLDPSRAPITARPGAWLRAMPNAWLLWLARPLIGTNRPAASLVMRDFRGKVSAAMVYDGVPMRDMFRKVDGETVMGVMEIRGGEREHPFVFWLRRV